MNPNQTDSLNALKSMLAPIYNSERRWSYEEECGLLLLMRVPNYLEEVAQVLEYWKSLPPHGKHLFPRSMQRLLSDWTGVLDNAAVAARTAETPEPATASQKILWHSELKRVDKRMKSLKDSYSENTNWSDSDRVEFKTLRERKKALLEKLGMIV
jgi:hypothetical protein